MQGRSSKAAPYQKGFSCMAIKYHCRKCGKRFVEWGAAKLNYKCPTCENEELARVGPSEEKVVRRQSLKRKPRRPVAAAHASEQDLIVPDIEEIEAGQVDTEFEPGVVPAAFLTGEDERGRVGLDLDDVIPGEELAETEAGDLALGDDIPFNTSTPALGEEKIDDSVVDSDEWPE
jgi:DNA-directed RNA polymerase subunit RPC12/RpoP